MRAYHEWMPIRQVQADDKVRIWRNFQICRLLDLTMLDTRQYDRDITDVCAYPFTGISIFSKRILGVLLHRLYVSLKISGLLSIIIRRR